ncbi:hypothetical protein ACFPM0_34785 [Pseudonocardia sulfidoxydans]|uniref:hypothetical protein n=1 Tax=Pseudonocardia sulfidoxydans TaxID=54011 RepID=UPI003608B2EA
MTDSGPKADGGRPGTCAQGSAPSRVGGDASTRRLTPARPGPPPGGTHDVVGLNGPPHESEPTRSEPCEWQ